LLDLIASVMTRGLNRIFHILPIRFNLWWGRRMGELTYYLSGKRKYITYANIKAAFYREKTPRQIKKLTKNAFRNISQTFMEILSLTKADARYMEKYVTIKHIDRLEKAAKNPKGMIFISAHFGNWELMIVKSVFVGFPLYLLARD